MKLHYELSGQPPRDGLSDRARQALREASQTEDPQGALAEREQMFLAAMSQASPEEQEQYDREILALREARAVGGGLHLTDMAEATPAFTGPSSWTSKIASKVDSSVSNGMRAEAALWFDKTSPELRKDKDIFSSHAMSQAQRLSGRFGEQAGVAYRSFLDHVSHLHKRYATKESAAGSGKDTGKQAANKRYAIKNKKAAIQVGDKVIQVGDQVRIKTPQFHNQDEEGEVVNLYEVGSVVPGHAGPARVVTVRLMRPDAAGKSEQSYPESGVEKIAMAAKKCERCGGSGESRSVDPFLSPVQCSLCKGSGVRKIASIETPENEGPCAVCKHPASDHWNAGSMEDQNGCEASGCDCLGYAPKADVKTAATETQTPGQVPGEVKYRKPSNEVFWPWELDDPDKGAADVEGTPTPGQQIADYPQPKRTASLMAPGESLFDYIDQEQRRSSRTATSDGSGYGSLVEQSTCRHCERPIIYDEIDGWVDPEAMDDDSIWRETCEAHDTFEAEHEPKTDEAAQFFASSEGQTCSVCGDKIEKNPDDDGYHHDNGEKHDHEAKASKELIAQGRGVESSRTAGNLLTPPDQWLEARSGGMARFMFWDDYLKAAEREGFEPESKVFASKTSANPEMQQVMKNMQDQIPDVQKAEKAKTLPCPEHGDESKYGGSYASFPSAHSEYFCPKGHTFRVKVGTTREQIEEARKTSSRRQATSPGLHWVSTPGHGFLAVPKAKYPDAKKFKSTYSGATSTHYLLEEDGDAPAFLAAHPEIDGNSLPDEYHESDPPGTPGYRDSALGWNDVYMGSRRTPYVESRRIAAEEIEQSKFTPPSESYMQASRKQAGFGMCAECGNPFSADDPPVEANTGAEVHADCLGYTNRTARRHASEKVNCPQCGGQGSIPELDGPGFDTCYFCQATGTVTKEDADRYEQEDRSAQWHVGSKTAGDYIGTPGPLKTAATDFANWDFYVSWDYDENTDYSWLEQDEWKDTKPEDLVMLYATCQAIDPSGGRHDGDALYGISLMQTDNYQIGEVWIAASAATSWGTEYQREVNKELVENTKHGLSSHPLKTSSFKVIEVGPDTKESSKTAEKKCPKCGGYDLDVSSDPAYVLECMECGKKIKDKRSARKKLATGLDTCPVCAGSDVICEWQDDTKSYLCSCKACAAIWKTSRKTAAGPYDDFRWQWVDDNLGAMGWFTDAEKSEHEGTKELSNGHFRALDSDEIESMNRAHNEQAYIQSSRNKKAARIASSERTRVVPSSEAGYGPGRYQAQYFDRDTGIWFDIGDPTDTEEDARAKADGHKQSSLARQGDVATLHKRYATKKTAVDVSDIQGTADVGWNDGLEEDDDEQTAAQWARDAISDWLLEHDEDESQTSTLFSEWKSKHKTSAHMEGQPELAKICPMCGDSYLDWALHIDEALGSCPAIDRAPTEEYFGKSALKKSDLPEIPYGTKNPDGSTTVPRRPSMTCSEVGEMHGVYSATPGDYWQMNPEDEFTCSECGAPMELVMQRSGFDPYQASRKVAGEKWRAEAAGVGENVWSNNAMEYDTREEAESAAHSLASRWMGADVFRVTPVSTPKREPVDLNDPDIVESWRKQGSRKGASLTDNPKVNMFRRVVQANLKQASRKRACVWAAEKGNCSDDLLEVYHGRNEPTYICGYHEERFGVPRSASKTASRKTAGARQDEEFSENRAIEVAMQIEERSGLSANAEGRIVYIDLGPGGTDVVRTEDELTKTWESFAEASEEWASGMYACDEHVKHVSEGRTVEKL